MMEVVAGATDLMIYDTIFFISACNSLLAIGNICQPTPVHNSFNREFCIRFNTDEQPLSKLENWLFLQQAYPYLTIYRC